MSIGPWPLKGQITRVYQRHNIRDRLRRHRDVQLKRRGTLDAKANGVYLYQVPFAIVHVLDARLRLVHVDQTLPRGGCGAIPHGILAVVAALGG